MQKPLKGLKRSDNVGYLFEKKLKQKIDEIQRKSEEMEERIEERFARFEDFINEASRPKDNEPAENKVKEKVNEIKENIEEKR